MTALFNDKEPKDDFGLKYQVGECKYYRPGWKKTMTMARTRATPPRHERNLAFSGLRRTTPARADTVSQQRTFTMDQAGNPYFCMPRSPNPVRKTRRLAIPAHINIFFLCSFKAGANAEANAMPVTATKLKSEKRWMILNIFITGRRVTYFFLSCQVAPDSKDHFPCLATSHPAPMAFFSTSVSPMLSTSLMRISSGQRTS